MLQKVNLFQMLRGLDALFLTCSTAPNVFQQ